jgi:RimJ/RimL family protein N-acetyltransferase
MTPVLETARLRLRPPRDGDVDDIVMYAGNPDVALPTAKIPHPYTEQDARDWLKWTAQAAVNGTEYTFILEDKANGRLMGAFALRVFREDRSGVIGYWLGAPYWNRGFTTEAAERIARYAFEELDLTMLRSSAIPSNVASIRVQEKLGMRHAGEGTEDAPARGAVYRVEVRELSRDEWRKRGAG